MDTLLFFSGGVDSTVLAAAIAREPYVFGLKPGKDSLLYLLTAKSKGTKLAPLFRWLQMNTEFRVALIEADCPLTPSEQEDMPAGGHQTTYPLLSGYAPDRNSAPYTAGYHLWLAAAATNLLAQSPAPPHGHRRAFWGFQEDGPHWEAFEAGKVPKNDASPGWVAALNALAGEAPTKVRFEAPFLDRRLDRTDIVRWGQALDVPFELTSSCMVSWNPKGCGLCHQCVRRQRVFNYCGVKT